MLAILNSDSRMNMVYQSMKKRVDCMLLDDFTVLKMKFDAIVLPMSGLRDDFTMIVRGIEMKVPLEFFDMLKEDGYLICGSMTPKLKELPQHKIDLSTLDEFIQANSKLTAEGVLFLLLDNTHYGLLDLQVDLLGYGNSGKAIYEILRRLGVQVRVVRRNLHTEDANFITVEQYQHVKPNSVIINTSLTNIIDDLMIRKMDEHLILNLVRSASFNEALLRQRHSRVVHAGPLPAMFAPASAARVLEDALNEIYHEN